VSAIRFIDEATEPDVAALGGKGAGLAFLVTSGVRVPPAFVVTAAGYRLAVGPDLRREVAGRISAIPADASAAALDEHTAAVRSLIIEGSAGHPLADELREACRELQVRTGDEDLTVAVRSSSIAEDAADKSFAGEHDTYLWVNGPEAVDRRVRECWASLVTTRAVAYRANAQDTNEELAMAVVVQQMVPARAAGVFMTLNPVNGDRSKVMIESVWGLGEPLVSGEANPDRFLVDKITGEIVKRQVCEKPEQAVRDPDSGAGVVLVPVEPARASEASLTGGEIDELVRIARLVERRAGVPQDGEFAVAHGSPPDNVYLVQCRPETVWSQRPRKPVAKGRTAMEAVLATLTQKSPPPAVG
jgi:pyruvate,water dikinase